MKRILFPIVLAFVGAAVLVGFITFFDFVDSLPQTERQFIRIDGDHQTVMWGPGRHSYGYEIYKGEEFVVRFQRGLWRFFIDLVSPVAETGMYRIRNGKICEEVVFHYWLTRSKWQCNWIDELPSDMQQIREEGRRRLTI